MKCVVCGKELYGSPVNICRSCYLESLDDKVCIGCGKLLSKEQIRRGFNFCSRSCYNKSSYAKSNGVELCERNKESTPWWNYKNFIRYPGNKLPYAYFYVVSTSSGIKVGISMYFYKRIEEITRCRGNRSEDSYVYRVYLMNTLDASYLESYIHRVFEHKNEYHRVEDLNAILGAVDNPKVFTTINHLVDDRNPNLDYAKELVFQGTYTELEKEFKSKTRECNLSRWTVNEHKEELYPVVGPTRTPTVCSIDDARLFELHDGLITHNCRLRLDLRELTRRNGGLFGSGDSTGSVGVVTINLPRLAYEAVHSKKTDKSAMDLFYESLYKYMDLAKESLIIKRDYLEREILSKHLLPAFETYVGTMDNHFSTIGLIGMNEMCQNLIGVGIHSSLGKQLSLEVLDAMRERLSDYQEETGDLWNLEATPAEATCVIGDTLIQTTEGNVPIKELVGRDDVHVICYDTRTNKLRIKRAHDIRKTGSNKSVVRVTFDNGQSEVLTPNHQVYTRTYHVEGRGRTRRTWYSYEWVPAGSLTEGTSVVSNYQYQDGCSGFSRDRIRNSCNGKLMHRFIYEELVGDIPDGYVIHHKDLDKSNNDLSNLEMMTSSEHKALHARLNNPRPDWIGDTNPFYGCHHTEDSIVKMCNSKGVKRITISDILPYKDLPYEEIANILGCSRDTVKRRMQDAGIWDSHTPNHKVVSVEYLEETYDVYNMEVEDCEDYFIGGSEGILVHNCYRLASIDKKDYPDIYTQGPDDAPYYTNSCHLPVKEVSTMKDLFDNQDELQCKFTGGTVVHLYCGGPMSGTQAKHIIRTICTNYSLPYVSISPVVTLCEEHGQLPTKSDTCPKCGRPTSQLQRITGYIRDTRYWNPGKKSEYSDRKQFQEFVI